MNESRGLRTDRVTDHYSTTERERGGCKGERERERKREREDDDDVLLTIKK